MTQREYREDTKRVVVTLIACTLFLCSTVGVMIHNAYKEGLLYTKTGTVIEIDEEVRLTTFVDTEGECWRFKGIKDWDVNDTIILTMNNNHTPQTVYDDKVIGACKE